MPFQTRTLSVIQRAVGSESEIGATNELALRNGGEHFSCVDRLPLGDEQALDSAALR